MEGDKPALRREFAGPDRNFIEAAKLRTVTTELSRPLTAVEFFVHYQLDCLEGIEHGHLGEQQLAAFLGRLNLNLVLASEQLRTDERVTRLGLSPEAAADLIRWSSRLIGRGDIYDDDVEICRNFPQLIRLLGAAVQRHQPFKEPELVPLVAGQLVAANARLLTAGDREVITRRTDIEHYAVNLMQAHLLLEA